MITSIAYIIIFGLLFGTIFQKLKLPRLLGMILAGMIIGPYCLQLLDSSILNISSEIRQIAFIIILTRAGLSLDIQDLKKVGRPAILLCFFPALIEIGAFTLLAPKILGISSLEGAIMGSVVAAVSPAVVVPKMLQLMDRKLGTFQGIPQMILAGASVDDVFVIVMFTVFTNLALGNEVSIFSFLSVPISILTGLLIGTCIGYVLSKVLDVFKIKDVPSFLLVLSLSFFMMQIESLIQPYIPFSGYLAIMAMGLKIRTHSMERTRQLNHIYGKSWEIAQIFLFVLVGASVNITYVFNIGWSSILLILCIMIIRMASVLICLLKTPLSMKERLFTMFAYSPKATVQAAMGGIPLAMGLSCGEIVLTVSVLAILITAPFGAITMDILDERCLKYAEK